MDYTKAYLKLANYQPEAIREKATRGGLGSRNVDLTPLEVPDQEDIAQKYYGMVKSISPRKPSVEEEPTEDLGPNPELGLEERYIEDEGGKQRRPQGRGDLVPEKIKQDPEFQKQVERLKKKFGISEVELYRVIQGESAFNPRATNPSGASGLLQFMPATAAELGWTTEEILSMAPAEQLKVYEQYLDRWDYDGSNSLGIMQGAPAFAKASPDTVVYKKGTAAWKQNPGWRPKGGGDITVGSMNSYYRKQSL